MIAATEVEPQIILDTSELSMGPFPRYFCFSMALSLKKENQKKKPKNKLYISSKTGHTCNSFKTVDILHYAFIILISFFSLGL